MNKLLVTALLSVPLCLCAPGPLYAQCPDGTPPPCSAAPARRAPARRAPPAVAERRRSFLVLPFRNLSRATEHEWLVEGSPVLLADALSRRDELTVVPDERLYPALRRAGLAPGGVMDLVRVRRVAGETGGWTAVTGEILAFGNRIRVSARAFDVVSNAEVVRAVEEGAPGEDVRAVYQRLGTRLIRAAGIDTATAADLAATTTGSLDAYRAYARGLAHANRSEPRRARDAFREAIRLDSAYAQAWARLVEAEISIDPRQLYDLQSPLYRYCERAVALADRLPARDREVVLALGELLRGRFADARARLTRLLAQDSTLVDALDWMANVESADPILVPAGAGERPRGSLNTALRLAKRALELDPSRLALYSNMVQTYLVAAGNAPGFVLGYRQEASSLPALFNSAPAATFIPILRDTIILIPAESLALQVPDDSLAAARRRALSAARQWSDRWLEAGRGQAEPHLWSSRVHSQAGDPAAALRELELADSIGVETGLENVPGRRMSLLAQLGRTADGRRIADSLWAAGALDATGMTAYAMENVGWAYMLFVLDRRYERTDSLLARTTQALAPASLANPQLTPAMLATLLLTGSITQFFRPPDDVKVTVLSQLLDDAARLPAGPLAQMLPFQVLVHAGDSATPERIALARRALAAASALHAAGQADRAYQLATEAGVQRAVRPARDSLPWWAARRQEARAVVTREQQRFRGVRAVVTDSVATFHWAADGATFAWNRIETGLGEPDYRFEVEIAAGGTTYEALTHASRRPGIEPRSGTLADLLGASVKQLHQIVSPDSTVPHRNLPRAVVRAEPEAGGFRVVIRDPTVLAAIRQARPATASFRFSPCVTAAGTLGRCAEQAVPVTYP